MNSFFLSRWLPPNAEGSAELCEAIGACVRTQERMVLPFLPTLAPFVGSAATLAKAKRLTHFYSVATLLEKWFACFPTSGDSLRFPCFPFISNQRQQIFYVCHFFIFRFARNKK